jgi:hypothetical protein
MIYIYLTSNLYDQVYTFNENSQYNHKLKTNELLLIFLFIFWFCILLRVI